ncbi:MAG: UPF0158 family protein [Myxococcales bacterium]|nr:UPF0158 family protein [Myxococcales bacterium]MDH3483621.1 UPF0158 family protein [Myxococcales bacterium]
MNENDSDVGQDKEQLEVPVAWEALEDAFENNAPEVHSYLHFDTGEVIRIVDGVADPAMHARILNDSRYLRIDPVSSREQYRWMERFIATVEDEDLRRRLNVAIDGKGAFRRFKDALMSHPVDRERWFAFRSERLRSCMDSWLTAHGIQSVERPKWHVPTVQEVHTEVAETPELRPPGRTSRVTTPDASRRRVHDLVDAVAPKDLEMARAFLELLATRRSEPAARPSDPPEAVPEAADTESN